jgi:hypothetical protein
MSWQEALEALPAPCFSLRAQQAVASRPAKQVFCSPNVVSAAPTLTSALDCLDSTLVSSERACLRSLPAQLLQSAAWVESVEVDCEEPRRKRACRRKAPNSAGCLTHALPAPLPRLALLPPSHAAAVLHALRLRVRSQLGRLPQHFSSRPLQSYCFPRSSLLRLCQATLESSTASCETRSAASLLLFDLCLHTAEAPPVASLPPLPAATSPALACAVSPLPLSSTAYEADEMLLKELLGDVEHDSAAEVLDVLERCVQQAGDTLDAAVPSLSALFADISDSARLHLCQALLTSRFSAACGQHETGTLLASLLLPRCLALGAGSAPRQLSSALAAAAQVAPLAAAAKVAAPLILACDECTDGAALVASRVELITRALSAQPGQQFCQALLDRLCEGTCGEAAVAVLLWMLEATASATPQRVSVEDLSVQQAELLAGVCERTAGRLARSVRFGKLLLILVKAGVGGPVGREALRRAAAATDTLLTTSIRAALDFTDSDAGLRARLSEQAHPGRGAVQLQH